MKNQKRNLTRSPLHYNGNKFSIADQILKYVDTKKRIVEVFGGTGIISVNSSSENIWINDTNKNLINLLRFINNFNELSKKKILLITEKFNLTSDMNKFANKRKNNGAKGYSEFNKGGFLSLRENYNKNPTVEKLFVLINYSFNRMIRFNSSGNFNVPVGKSDWSKRQLKYLEEYQDSLSNKIVNFSCKDYRDVLKEMTTEDFVYLDPPYLNGTAQYNNGWGILEEEELYDQIDKIHAKGIEFALSNTLFSNGMLNATLDNWIKNNNFKVYEIEKKYSKTSHNKKNRYDAREVLITNVCREEKNGI